MVGVIYLMPLPVYRQIIVKKIPKRLPEIVLKHVPYIFILLMQYI